MKALRSFFPPNYLPLFGIQLVSSVAFSLLYMSISTFLPLESYGASRHKMICYWIAIPHSLFCFSAALLAYQQKMEEKKWIYLLAITQGYFLYDFFMMLFFAPFGMNKVIMLVHHLAIFIISIPQKLRPYLKLGLLSECALPFLYVGFLLNIMAPAYTKTIFFNLLCGVILLFYFIFRICLFSYLVWQGGIALAKEKKQKIMGTLIMILFLMITLINYYWFSKLLKVAYKHLFKS